MVPPTFSTIIKKFEKQSELKFAGPIETLARLKRNAEETGMSEDTLNEFEKALRQTKRLRRKYVQEYSAKQAFNWTDTCLDKAWNNHADASKRMELCEQALPMSQDAETAANVPGPTNAAAGNPLPLVDRDAGAAEFVGGVALGS